MKNSPAAKRAEALAKAARYLADANAAKERGQRKTADRLYEKAQEWLDRYNELSGDA